VFRACIHRGARQIGGSCIELECRGERLVLDLGLPLESTLENEAELPSIAGLDGSDKSLRGVVISHGHPDHYGLAGRLPPSVPVFVGDATARILKEALFFTGAGLAVQPAGCLADREPFSIGPFRVTPYLVDHSAFDAYALHVQADGRTLFYSGDLRTHGRKSSLMERLISDPPGVDVLMLEGTRIDERGAGERGAASERDVEEQALAVFRQAHGIVVVFYSPQNIDRLVGLYRAARRARRVFVFDLYAAAIAFATGRATIPQAHWNDVRVFVPQSQRVRVKETGEFHRTAALRSSRIFPGQLREQCGQLVLTCRSSMLGELERTGCLNESARALWSIWPGYLQQPAGVRLRERLDGLGVPLTIAHASGHATVADLTRLVSAMRPERVVPIHTASPARFLDSFDRAELRADGEWWDI
jgi:ribonuclease J